MELAEGTPLGNYVVGPAIGAGGMAVVFRAKHAVLGTDHALKLILLPKVRERVLKEGRVQAALRHPNIVSVTDVVVFRGAPGLVLEYVHGPSLERLLSRHQRLSLPQVDALAAGLLDGVAEAHQHHLVHRDLKPANILLQQTPTGFVPKVCDFGLVKVAEEHKATKTGATMGTPSYMAPEQFRNTSAVDHRADIFALGCILYEILTGEQAFPGDNLLAVHYATCTRNYQKIPELRPDAPPAMVAAIEAALSPEPDDRPADVAALRALWLADRPRSPTDAIWPTEWLAEEWSPPPADLPSHSWDEATSEAPLPAAPTTTDLSTQVTLDRLPLPRRGLHPVLAGALVGLGVSCAWWLMPSAEAELAGPSLLGLHPADTLHDATRGRLEPLVIAVAPLDAIGVDPAIGAAIQRALVARLRTESAIDVRPAAEDPRAPEDVWLAVAQREGAEAVLRGSVGKRGVNTLVSLERIDAAAGEAQARGFIVVSPGEDLGTALEFLAATVLSRDPQSAPDALRDAELQARRAELEACNAAGSPAEVRLSVAPDGRATVVRAPQRIAPCVAQQVATWLLPPGNDAPLTWTLGR